MRKFLTILNETEVLDEMPITNFQTVGDFNKSSSFRHPEDRKLLTSPKAVAKIHKKFANNEFDFAFFFVNSPEANRHTEIGLVDDNWMAENMPKAWPEIQPALQEGAINVVFTNNKGSERYPMTAWIIAHRLGHVFYARRGGRTGNFWAEAEKAVNDYTSDILRDFGINKPSGGYGGYGRDNYAQMREYDKYRRNLYHAIGTMKSARDNNLRNAHEFMHEMLAQYLTTGNITMTPATEIITHYAWGTPQKRWAGQNKDQVQDKIERFAADMNYYMENMLHAAVGHIFVM
jgi:hypothetical protein